MSVCLCATGNTASALFQKISTHSLSFWLKVHYGWFYWQKYWLQLLCGWHMQKYLEQIAQTTIRQPTRIIVFYSVYKRIQQVNNTVIKCEAVKQNMIRITRLTKTQGQGSEGPWTLMMELLILKRRLTQKYHIAWPLMGYSKVILPAGWLVHKLRMLSKGWWDQEIVSLYRWQIFSTDSEEMELVTFSKDATILEIYTCSYEVEIKIRKAKTN